MPWRKPAQCEDELTMKFCDSEGWAVIVDSDDVISHSENDLGPSEERSGRTSMNKLRYQHNKI